MILSKKTIFSYLDSFKNNFIKKIQAFKSIIIYTHDDCDGICSLAIIIIFLKKVCPSIQIQYFIKKEVPNSFNIGVDEALLLLDLGSSIPQSNLPKNSWIIDHHQTNRKKSFFFCNVSSVFDTTTSVLCSIICYEYLSSYQKVFGLVGLIGDRSCFSYFLNRYYIDYLLKEGLILKEKSLSLYGIETTPFLQLLYYLFFNQLGRDNFLAQISLILSKPIEIIKPLFWRDFLEEDLKKISSFMQFHHIDLPQEITSYTLINFPEPICYPIEFSVYINSCGKMGYPKIALNFLLQQISLSELEQYRKLYKYTLRKYFQQKPIVYDFCFFNCYFYNSNQINPRFTGLMASRYLSNHPKKISIVVSEICDSNSKISFRSTIPLFSIVNLFNNLFLTIGGHEQAIGITMLSIFVFYFLLKLNCYLKNELAPVV